MREFELYTTSVSPPSPHGIDPRSPWNRFFYLSTSHVHSEPLPFVLNPAGITCDVHSRFIRTTFSILFYISSAHLYQRLTTIND